MSLINKWGRRSTRTKCKAWTHCKIKFIYIKNTDMYPCWGENTPNLSKINSKARMILELRKKLSCYHKHFSIILICWLYNERGCDSKLVGTQAPEPHCQSSSPIPTTYQPTPLFLYFLFFHTEIMIWSPSKTLTN